MKIIGKLIPSLSSLESVGGNLAHINVDRLVVVQTDDNKIGIFEPLPTVNEKGEVGVEFMPKVIAANPKLMMEWIGSQYRFQRIITVDKEPEPETPNVTN